jgi:hypothetical protein
MAINLIRNKITAAKGTPVFFIGQIPKIKAGFFISEANDINCDKDTEFVLCREGNTETSVQDWLSWGLDRSSTITIE